jgi:hypothetical protein
MVLARKAHGAGVVHAQAVDEERIAEDAHLAEGERDRSFHDALLAP